MSEHIHILGDCSGYATDVYSGIGSISSGPIPEKNTTVLITRLDPVDASMIAGLPLLKVIGSSTTGTNHIDLDWAKKNGVRVVNLLSIDIGEIDAAAIHAFGLILSLFRNYRKAFNYPSHFCTRYDCQGNDLKGKTLGIIGYGRIGKKVANWANVFGMNIVTHDKDDEYSNGPEYLLNTSDVVLLSVPLNKETASMIGYEEFSVMKKSAYFVNISRAEVVQKNTLLMALEENLIAGAATDVMHNENLFGDLALIRYAQSHDNLIITPHIGGCTAESLEKTDIILANKVVSSL